MEKRQGLSEKQEEFCRLLAEGKTTGEAERLIGFSKGYGIRPKDWAEMTTPERMFCCAVIEMEIAAEEKR